jgi:ABC-type lipoprotein export system ATPase subunit
MTSTDDMETVRCRGVSKTYRSATSDVPALVEVDFTSGGAVTALFGPSGSGKTTLLRLLAGLERPDGGEIALGPHVIGAMTRRSFRRLQRSDLALVFQQPSYNLLEYLTAREQLMLAAQLRGRGHGEVDALLERVGLAARAGHTPAQLSGGEQQRLAFASAVVGGPRWVLADEPTAELDAASAGRVLEVVVDLAEHSQTTFVLASHDPAVRDVASSLVSLLHGRIVDQ